MRKLRLPGRIAFWLVLGLSSIVIAPVCAQVTDTSYFQIRDVVDSTRSDQPALKNPRGLTYFVGDTAFITDVDLEGAKPWVDDRLDPTVGAFVVTLTPRGTMRWSRLTASRVGKRLAIIAGGWLWATPLVEAPDAHSEILVRFPCTTTPGGPTIGYALAKAIEEHLTR